MVRIEGDYESRGYAVIRRLVPREVSHGLVQLLQNDLAAAGSGFAAFEQTRPLMRRPTYEVPGHIYTPLITFLWGLTPMMCTLTGKSLLPSYDFFRIYQQDDICRLHSDRPSCEHSLSLTLAYSDDKPWPFHIGSERMDGPDYLKEDFGSEPHSAIEMQPGDAVLYQGYGYRHGRIAPNPNRWSAHLFLHYVDRNGPFAEHAFDAVRIREEEARAAPGASGIRIAKI